MHAAIFAATAGFPITFSCSGPWEFFSGIADRAITADRKRLGSAGTWPSPEVGACAGESLLGGNSVTLDRRAMCALRPHGRPQLGPCILVKGLHCHRTRVSRGVAATRIAAARIDREVRIL